MLLIRLLHGPQAMCQVSENETYCQQQLDCVCIAVFCVSPPASLFQITKPQQPPPCRQLLASCR